MNIIESRVLYEQGIFPYEGTHGQQPNKFVEAVQLVQNLLIEHQDEQKKALDKAKFNKNGK
jgi:hypothetical protein